MSTTSGTKKTPTPAETRVTESAAQGSDGTRLYVRRRGGPGATTLLLSDGICCDGFIYKYLWDDLARVGPVAHWNYRGHGRSANPADVKSATNYVSAALTDARSGKPVVTASSSAYGCTIKY